MKNTQKHIRSWQTIMSIISNLRTITQTHETLQLFSIFVLFDFFMHNTDGFLFHKSSNNANVKRFEMEIKKKTNTKITPTAIDFDENVPISILYVGATETLC